MEVRRLIDNYLTWLDASGLIEGEVESDCDIDIEALDKSLWTTRSESKADICAKAKLALTILESLDYEGEARLVAEGAATIIRSILIDVDRAKVTFPNYTH